MIRQNDIRDIANTFADNTLSLYLHVDAGYIENQADTPAWQIYLKNSLSETKQSLDESQKEDWNAITEQLDDFFQAYSPSGRTLAVFVNGDQIVTEELPFGIDNQHYFGQPYVSPLLWAIDEYEQYLVVMVDSESAQFHKAYLGNLETEAEMTIDLDYDWGEKSLMPPSNASNSGEGTGHAVREGSNRDAFDDMISAHVDRFYSDIADKVKEFMSDEQPMRLILGGDERAAHALEDKLHESVTKHFVAVLPIPMTASSSEIMKRIATTAYNYERNFEYELVEDVMSSAFAGGSGALGRDGLDTAMTMQQVELFIIPYDLLQEDKDYVHDITMWALDNNSRIEFIHGQAANKLKSNGGIAARLYYSIETAQ